MEELTMAVLIMFTGLMSTIVLVFTSPFTAGYLKNAFGLLFSNRATRLEVDDTPDEETKAK